MWERHGLYSYVAAWVPTVLHELGSVNLTCPEENSHKPDHDFYRNVLVRFLFGRCGCSPKCIEFLTYQTRASGQHEYVDCMCCV